MSDWYVSLGRDEQERAARLSAIYRDGGRFPCGDCGQMVTATERHTWADCRKVQP